jgi:hypothetical protein
MPSWRNSCLVENYENVAGRVHVVDALLRNSYRNLRDEV